MHQSDVFQLLYNCVLSPEEAYCGIILLLCKLSFFNMILLAVATWIEATCKLLKRFKILYAMQIKGCFLYFHLFLCFLLLIYGANCQRKVRFPNYLRSFMDRKIYTHNKTVTAQILYIEDILKIYNNTPLKQSLRFANKNQSDVWKRNVWLLL